MSLLIRKTLGWSDENGKPQAEQHRLTWADFDAAGVNRDMIRKAVAEAVAGHFISCVQAPQAKKTGQPAVSGLYELKWDERPEYLKDPRLFRGFYAGEGNRTYIPNQFFDVCVPGEPLSVVKVVGSVIRFSIGFQNKWGHRRRNVSLSYRHIQNYSLIRDRKSLSGALRQAMKSNYIERVKEGYFDPNAGKLSRAAVYAVKWLGSGAESAIGRKNPPERSAADRWSEKPTGIGRKTLPEDRSEIPTGIEIKQVNKTLKQQTPEAAASFEVLKNAGFDDRAADALACRYPFERIDRQLRWIEGRGVRRNRLGMLRKAIEEDWVKPGSAGSAARELGAPNYSVATESFEEAIRRIERRLSDSSPS